MSPETFGSFIRAYAVWALAYLTIGWLMFGLMVQLKDVPGGRERQTFIACMLVWPFALALELWRLVMWILAVAAFGTARLFNPDSGPLARATGTLAMWGRHWGARFRGRDPYAPTAEPVVERRLHVEPDVKVSNR